MLKFTNVSKKYGSRKILTDVSFMIPAQNITVMLGPNGAGKSTIVLIALGLIQPDHGLVETEINSQFAYLPQRFVLNHMMPADVSFIFQNLTHNSLLRSPEILEELKDFADFSKLKDRQIRDLSDGQKQKLFIAAVLAKNADLIILDEPTQNLDISSQNAFYNLIVKFKFLGSSVFIISHDLHTVTKIADQVLCLNNHICCSGMPQETQIFSNGEQDTLANYQHQHDHVHNN